MGPAEPASSVPASGAHGQGFPGSHRVRRLPQPLRWAQAGSGHRQGWQGGRCGQVSKWTSRNEAADPGSLQGCGLWGERRRVRGLPWSQGSPGLARLPVALSAHRVRAGLLLAATLRPCWCQLICMPPSTCPWSRDSVSAAVSRRPGHLGSGCVRPPGSLCRRRRPGTCPEGGQREQGKVNSKRPAPRKSLQCGALWLPGLRQPWAWPLSRANT